MVFKAVLSICFLFVGSSLCLPQQHKNLCDENGEKYWCQNVETATKCGVLAYCQLRHPKMMEKTAFQPKMMEKTAFQPKVLDHQPVVIELYYESLCGGCQAFITEQLYPAYQKLYSTGILQIGLYPYGNAEEKKNPDGTYSFTCQHGAEECTMNIVETCAVHILHDQAAFMPYIHCIESSGPSIPNALACADKLKVDWSKISTCMNSTQGNEYEHEMAVKTDALSPSHNYVPWITMNGKHTDEIQDQAQDDLIKLVCDNYVGTQPHACRIHKSHRCYKN